MEFPSGSGGVWPRYQPLQTLCLEGCGAKGQQIEQPAGDSPPFAMATGKICLSLVIDVHVTKKGSNVIL